jgi:hypothetical protein
MLTLLLIFVLAFVWVRWGWGDLGDDPEEED